MQNWILYAVLSMVFAGVTAIFGKAGLENIHADLGLGIRTTIIFLIITTMNIVDSRYREIHLLTKGQWLALSLSAVATTLSWIFYYRAMKDGPLSYVTVIDKGSILITLILSFVIFREPVTPKVLIAGALIFTGLVVLAWK